MTPQSPATPSLRTATGGPSAELTIEDARKLYEKFADKDGSDAVQVMAEIALWGKRQQVEGGRLRLLALRQLGRFLIRNGRGRGRPPRAWCEIKDGRDFLQWNQRVDWIITNPPWSAEPYRAIARHAYEIADNVVFLARWHNATSTYPRHRDWLVAGHSWRETIYVEWKDAEFRDKHGTEKREGYILAAFWWSRGWSGGMRETYWTDDIGSEAMREAAE